MRDDPQDLVDNPAETLSVEHKQWLDLTDKGVRADLARHIAALANHGGGVIVFGFTDDMKFAGANPFAAVDRDVIASIVTKYLEPPFHCDVHSL
ncbi:MAG: ATP-binding protein, partial [Alphaproteobacteria bacterium]|nr:ATP-binding protein [Alphaproteobacteria bacterium]